jgi:hypothetical protein
MPTAANSLNISQSGYVVFDGTATFTGRTFQAGTGISLTNASGISGNTTITATGGGIAWVDVTGPTQAMSVNTGYTADDGGTLITFTLPTSAALGDTVIVQGKGSGLFTITYGTGQQIIFGTATSTATSGNVSSNKASDQIQLRCSTASLTAPIFTVQNSQGTFSVT